MSDIQVNDPALQRIGEEWISALAAKDFQRIAGLCQLEVHSRLMTPKRFDEFENAGDLSRKVEKWFGECSSIQPEQTRIAWVGEKLGIFYRLSFEKEGQQIQAEQQLYCTLREGLIDAVNLVCSGFQPVREPVAAPVGEPVSRPAAVNTQTAQTSIHTDALLKFDTQGGQGPTCSLLTPSIKRKLGELNSGQVLEVQVDDPSAKEDIESWCRLSGNALLKSEIHAGQELHAYLMKK